MKLNLYCLPACILAILMTGCANVGLAAIPQTREGYNAALSKSDNEQFLLNIVRMHFGQTPYFVNVDNMVTQSTLTTGGNGVLTNGINGLTTGAGGPFWSVTPTVSFTQTPTITYSPLQGTQFVSGMLTPLNMDKLSLLLQSGWSSCEVFKLTTEHIGSLINGTSALHPFSTLIPKQRQFNAFVELLDQLDLADRIEYSTTKYNDRTAIVITIMDNEAATEIAHQLGLSKPYNEILLSRAVALGVPGPENIIPIQTRSFFSMLNFLSNGVENADDTFNTAHGIHEKITAGNMNYAFSTLTKNLFSVKVSNKEPKNSVAKIQFEGKWYAIADEDTISKATLVLLRITYALQVGDLKANVPLITIPTR